MFERLFILLIAVVGIGMFALLIELQPARPPIMPGTLYSTWKAPR